MSNHYHFLIRVSDIPLGKLMAPLLGGYAGYYNRRYGRSGYVFQNRFTSILCDEQSYLLSLVRYIHLNPLRAGLVESLSALADYPWAGHAGMLSRHRQRWHRSEEMLARFGQSRRHAIRRYLEFLGAETSASCEINLAGGGLVRSHGGWEGIARLRKEHLQCIGDERIL
jgi:putative transposase